MTLLKKDDHIKVWLDKHGIIVCIENGWSRDPGNLIGVHAVDLISDRAIANIFKQTLAQAFIDNIPSARFTAPLLIDGQHQTRYATIRKDPDDNTQILVNFYAVEV